MITYIILFHFLYCILLVLFLMFSTSVHEYIHFLCANKYKSCNALIFSQFNIYKKSPAIRWVKKPLFKGGETYLDNDFLAYTPKQIRVIAIMPSVVTSISYLLFTAGFCAVIYAIFHKYVGYEYILSFYVITGIIISLWFLLKGRMTWCDRSIFLNPKGFISYMKNQHEHSLADSYQYNLIKKGQENASQKHSGRHN